MSHEVTYAGQAIGRLAAPPALGVMAFVALRSLGHLMFAEACANGAAVRCRCGDRELLVRSVAPDRIEILELV